MWSTLSPSRLAAAGLALALAAGVASAASHREAPLIALDPAADITDFYAFVSYDAANLARPPAERKATLILNVIPGQEPGAGPNYYAFDDTVLYEIKIDNDRDGVANDLVYQFRFTTEVRTPGQVLATLGGGPLPPISAIDGPGSEGMARIQRYTVTELRDCRTFARGPRCKSRTVLFDGVPQPTVPSNIGPRTMPNYDALRAQGIRTDPATGIRVFAGQNAETFAIDLGAVFDTLNLRVEHATPIPMARPPLPIQTAAEDANDAGNPFGVNNFSGFNVSSIAIEVPIARLTADGQPAHAGNALIGAHGATSRQMMTVRAGEPGQLREGGRPLVAGKRAFRQVARLANPLVNELIIPVGRKDYWNASAPEDEAQFLDAYRALDIAAALNAVSGVPVPAPPRNDVVGILLKYPGQDPAAGPYADLLRLDLAVPPTPPTQIKRLTILAHDAVGTPTPDPAGFPNGRRPNDDVTDILVRVAGGQAFIDNYVGDGVGLNERGITPDFPFLPAPYDGRNRRHVDPGES